MDYNRRLGRFLPSIQSWSSDHSKAVGKDRGKIVRSIERRLEYDFQYLT